MDTLAKRRGDWIQLISGEPFWPLDSRPEDIQIHDIAWALSMQCRFGGHCKRFYSVAEHSVMVSQLVPSKLALWGLLHDAAEAYLVDLPRPIKQNMPEYRAYEDELTAVISIRFGLSTSMPPEVWQADAHILTVERYQLMAKSRLEWEYPQSKIANPDNTMASPVLQCWEPKAARAEFLKRFAQLVG